MPFHLPSFDHGLVEHPATDGGDEQYEESDAGDAAEKAEEGEVDHGGDGGAQVGGKAGVVPEEEAEARVEKSGVEVGEGDVGVEEEAKEVREGLERDAVGGPGAVVIHLGDTGAAVAAVVCTKRLGCCAFFAPAGGEGLIDGGIGRRGGGRGGRVWSVEFLCVGEVVAAWGYRAGFVVGRPYADEEDVENGRFTLGHGTWLEVLGGVEEPLRGVAEESDQKADAGDEEPLEAVRRGAGEKTSHDAFFRTSFLEMK